jgi:hypothetical protein
MRIEVDVRVVDAAANLRAQLQFQRFHAGDQRREVAVAGGVRARNVGCICVVLRARIDEE